MEGTYLVTSKTRTDCGSKQSIKAKHKTKVCSNSAQVVYKELQIKWGTVIEET